MKIMITIALCSIGALILILSSCVVSDIVRDWAYAKRNCDTRFRLSEFLNLYSKDSTCWQLEDDYVRFDKGLYFYKFYFSFTDYLKYKIWKYLKEQNDMKNKEKEIYANISNAINDKYKLNGDD